MKTTYYLIAALTLATAGAAMGAEEPASANTVSATTATAAAATTATVVQQAPKQGLTRAEVKAQVIAARQNGTLIETEADMDVARTRQHYAQ